LAGATAQGIEEQYQLLMSSLALIKAAGEALLHNFDENGSSCPNITCQKGHGNIAKALINLISRQEGSVPAE
jgi:hypothetical protein